MYSFILKLSLLCSSFVGPRADVDHWVAISPVTKNSFIESSTDHVDPSIWALFSANFEGENLMIRMPEDPIYRYLSNRAMEITSYSQGVSYSLNVLKAVSPESVEEQIKELFLQPGTILEEIQRKADQRWDVVFRKEGKWVAKTYLLKGDHLYIFLSEGALNHRENHRQFVSSLDVKPVQK